MGRLCFIEKASELVREFLRYIGEDPLREGLQGTPERVIKTWEFLCKGYREDVSSLMVTFDAEGYDQMVLLKDIELYSICEHHLLPFFGRAHVAYIPKGRVIGVSKLARIVEVFSRRLQLQERICSQVVGVLDKYLQPRGTACVIEAEHLCMRMRGVEKQNSVMVTSALSGVFLEDSKCREELFGLIGLKGR